MDREDRKGAAFRVFAARITVLAIFSILLFLRPIKTASSGIFRSKSGTHDWAVLALPVLSDQPSRLNHHKTIGLYTENGGHKMKRVFYFTMIPALLALVLSGAVAQAGCPCESCGETCGDCGGCDHGCGCGCNHGCLCGLLAPIGWVAQVLGLNCPNCGCSHEQYWGDCEPCTRSCCPHVGGCGCGCGGGEVFEGPAQGVPHAGCNCGNNVSYRQMPAQGVYASRYQTAPVSSYANQNATRRVSGMPTDSRPRVISVTDHVVTPADNR
jgi:hypothetical protein